MLQQSSCPSCGAPVILDATQQQVVCPYCRSPLVSLQHGNTITLELSEQAAQTLLGAGRGNEQERLRNQRFQELSSLEMQLTQVQAEIRYLERGELTDSVDRQLDQLDATEERLLERIRILRKQLNLDLDETWQETSSTAPSSQQVTDFKASGPYALTDWERTLGRWIVVVVSGLTVFGVFTFGEWHPAKWVLGAILGIAAVIMMYKRLIQE